jgi:hypothetical protein
MTARRVPLAELDALTDRIEPLLARLDTIWRRVEAELRAQRTTTTAAGLSQSAPLMGEPAIATRRMAQSGEAARGCVASPGTSP